VVQDSVDDFGMQFTRHSNIEGVWGSQLLLKQSTYPFDLEKIQNKKICEVGSGSGRYLKNFLKFNPDKVTAIDPAESIHVAQKNVQDERIEFLKIDSTKMEIDEQFDYVFSLGVIHHIPRADAAVENIYRSLKVNGQFVMWVYGYENNELYILIFNNLRKFLSKIPDFLVEAISYFLALTTYTYGYLCKFFNLPLKQYFLNVFSQFSFTHRVYVIFDQLNPKYSKYYKKEETIELLENVGFKIDEIYHRDKYSWTTIATKLPS
tara:strand:- start:1389 stop:2177 length:789 start_codon:yes stop_codon:yes gene_type:complete